MNRLLTSLALLVATLVPAQAGLLDWGNSSPTNLNGIDALFTTTGDDGIANIDPGDIICGIFDFGTINGRDVFGFMKAQVSFDGNTFAAPQNGSDRLETLLSASGSEFETQFNNLTTVDATPDSIFALFSSTTAQDLNSVVDPTDAYLGLTSSAFELDLLAGVADAADTLSIAGNDFLMGLTVTYTNGATSGFEDISYGSSGNSSQLVTTGSPLATITDLSGFAFQIESTNATNLQFNAVPEPTSLAILGLVGVAGTAMRRRRK